MYIFFIHLPKNIFLYEALAYIKNCFKIKQLYNKPP